MDYHSPAARKIWCCYASSFGNCWLKNVHFLHSLAIFKNSVIFLMLSAGLLMHGQIFADSYRHCAMREGGEDGYFWCKKGIGRNVFF